MTCDGTRPEELAAELGISPKTLRAWLRDQFPRGAGEHGGPWFLTHQQVSAARQRYHGRRVARGGTSPAGRGKRPSAELAPPPLGPIGPSDVRVAGPLATDIVRALQGTPVSVTQARRSVESGGLPDEHGFYAWWTGPGTIPGVPYAWHPDRNRDLVLFYVGIAPNGPKSSSTIRSRVIGNHLSGNTGSSTFRFSLASLLRPVLRLHPLRTETKVVLPLAENRELTAWMNQHLRITWYACAEPWIQEAGVIVPMGPPLNLADNHSHPFYGTVSKARSEFRKAARPVRMVEEGR